MVLMHHFASQKVLLTVKKLNQPLSPLKDSPLFSGIGGGVRAQASETSRLVLESRFFTD